jgi:hypothetical protein
MRSTVGGASTWIGVADRARDFIQIGTLENVIRRFGRTQRDYRAFWSDTDLRFFPHDLGPVKPGDVVEAEMVQRRAGWQLRVTDVTHPLVRRVDTQYGPRVRFFQAQWIQEDPAHASNPAVDVAYPSMASVTFRSLLLNRRRPVLPYRDAHVLASPNEVVLVPTRVQHNSFSVLPATALQAQYVRDVAPSNAAANVVYDALNLHEYGAIGADTAALITAGETLVARLKSQTWPSRAAAGVAAIINSVQGAIPQWRAWSTTRAPTLKAFAATLNTKPRLAAAHEIRAALDLPH